MKARQVWTVDAAFSPCFCFAARRVVARFCFGLVSVRRSVLCAVLLSCIHACITPQQPPTYVFVLFYMMMMMMMMVMVN